MVTRMADFPPNPEDGELWLPSEIIHEITSANVTVPPPIHTLLPHHHHHPPPPSVPPNFQICFGSFGVSQNGVRPELAVPSQPLSFYNPITPVVQGFEEKGSMVYVEKYGGTGVFLPLPRSNSRKKPEENRSIVAVATQKKKKSGKKEGGSNEEMKWSSMRKESVEKREQYSQLPSGSCLPQDWTY